MKLNITVHVDDDLCDEHLHHLLRHLMLGFDETQAATDGMGATAITAEPEDMARIFDTVGFPAEAIPAGAVLCGSRGLWCPAKPVEHCS